MIGAVEIGGTHVAAARVELATATVDPHSRVRLPLRPDGARDELLESILGAARMVDGPGVESWGVAAPGPFDYERGVCKLRGVAKLESLYGVDLRGELAAALGLADGTAVRFLNDADAFLLGEWSAGAARGHARAVGITLGTGLGSAFLVEGRIVEDGPGVAPEGSLHLVPFRGAPVEETISRRGLLERYGAGSAEVDVEQIAERARGGEERARETFEGVASDLGEFLVPWVEVFAPTGLVVGGSIARSWDLIAPPLRRGLREIEGLRTVTVAANLDDAPLLGAAAYAAEGR